MKKNKCKKVKKCASVTFLHTHLCCHSITVALASHLSLMILFSECAQVSVFFSSDTLTGLFMGCCQPGSASY